MFVHVPTFNEFLAGREFDSVTLQQMKDAWNAATIAADAFMEDAESYNYKIAEALRVE